MEIVESFKQVIVRMILPQKIIEVDAKHRAAKNKLYDTMDKANNNKPPDTIGTTLNSMLESFKE